MEVWARSPQREGLDVAGVTFEDSLALVPVLFR